MGIFNYCNNMDCNALFFLVIFDFNSPPVMPNLFHCCPVNFCLTCKNTYEGFKRPFFVPFLKVSPLKIKKRFAFSKTGCPVNFLSKQVYFLHLTAYGCDIAQ